MKLRGAEPAHFTSESHSHEQNYFGSRSTRIYFGGSGTRESGGDFAWPPFGTILMAAGFIADGNNWIVREKDLDISKPAEVKSAEVVAAASAEFKLIWPPWI